MGLRDLITAVAASPAASQAIVSGVAALADGALRLWRSRKASEDPLLSMYRAHLERLDRLIERMPAAEPVTSGVESAGGTPTPEPLPPADQAPPAGEGSGSPADISAACVPCARAHLIGVRGDLREALRFARESGMDHPEARRRIDHAAEEVVMLERYDLTPEAIAKAPPEEQAVIRELLPGIRKLRQRLLNQIHDVEDLELAAIEASQLYETLQAKTRKVPPAPSPVPQVKADQSAQKECSPCKLAAAVAGARTILQQHGLPDDGLLDVEDRCGVDATCIRSALETAREQVRGHAQAYDELGVILEETFGQQARPAA